MRTLPEATSTGGVEIGFDLGGELPELPLHQGLFPEVANAHADHGPRPVSAAARSSQARSRTWSRVAFAGPTANVRKKNPPTTPSRCGFAALAYRGVGSSDVP